MKITLRAVTVYDIKVGGRDLGRFVSRGPWNGMLELNNSSANKTGKLIITEPSAGDSILAAFGRDWTAEIVSGSPSLLAEVQSLAAMPDPATAEVESWKAVLP